MYTSGNPPDFWDSVSDQGQLSDKRRVTSFTISLPIYDNKDFVDGFLLV
jgi:hypothetical protein